MVASSHFPGFFHFPVVPPRSFRGPRRPRGGEGGAQDPTEAQPYLTLLRPHDVRSGRAEFAGTGRRVLFCVAGWFVRRGRDLVAPVVQLVTV